MSVRVVVCGLNGAGKSTLGRALAVKNSGYPFASPRAQAWLSRR